MPPVFGPSSPSRSRLRPARRRAATARRRRRARTPRPRALEQLLDDDAGRRTRGGPADAVVGLALRAADEDALAGGEPVRLDDARRAARPSSVAAVATPAARSTSFANAFEPSMRAAAAPGPKTATPRGAARRLRPATSGASGPTTTRSISPRSAEREEALAVVGPHRVAAPRPAMPGLPGRGVQLAEPRTAGELPGERVLPSAGSHEQHVHPASRIGRQRVRSRSRWPTPRPS